MNDPKEKPKRRWFQFSLRSLLILVTLSAVPLGWLGFRLRQAQVQRQAIHQITSLGGGGIYDVHFDDSVRSYMEARPPGMGLVSEHIHNPKEVSMFSNVVAVDLSSHSPGSLLDPTQQPLTLGGIEMISPITDDDLTCLAGLRYLRWLRLENTLVSDEGLRHLNSLGTLDWLNLRNTNISDEGISKLRSKLPNCEIIR